MATVIATQRGFFNKLREPGEKFNFPLAKGQKLPSWMELADKPKVDAETALDLDDDEGAEGTEESEGLGEGSESGDE